MQKKLSTMKAFFWGSGARRKMLSSEKGVVLIVVIVLSAVVFVIMTTLIYMITTGTQVSGLQKRYKTALEAGAGGSDIFYQFIALRGSGETDFINNLTTFNINLSSPPNTTCTGVISGATYTGFTAKLMTPSPNWVNCDRALNIDTEAPSTYDVRVQLGTTTRYNVYAKIVATVSGNTGGESTLLTKGVVSANSGEVTVSPVSSLYAIEAVAENNARRDERAKFSILYQY